MFVFKLLLNLFLSLSFLISSIIGGGNFRPEGAEYMAALTTAVNALVHKNEIIDTKYFGEAGLDKWSPGDLYEPENIAVVMKEKGKDFIILNLTDIHFSDYDIRAWMAFPTIATIKKLVKRVKPDMITVTGDIVCGESTVYAIKRFTGLMDSFGIPWAPVFGNHDAEGNCDYNYLADVMMKSRTCLLKKGDPALGIGNYVVNIAEENPAGSPSIIHSLIFMDSNKTHVSAMQTEWYKWAAKGICDSCGKSVSSSVFFHIPLAEYQYAYDEAWDGENGVWRPGYDAFGALNEKICCDRDQNGQPVNNGFFAAVLETGTTKNIICGHDHMNDFSVVYRGVRLSYTLKAGKGSGYQPGFNGGTVISIGSGGSLALKHCFVLSLL